MAEQVKEPEAEIKEWVKVGHSQGRTTVTVTLVQGNLSVKWQVKTFVNEIKAGRREARRYAHAALEALGEDDDD
jgi:hypothetical protein